MRWSLAPGGRYAEAGPHRRAALRPHGESLPHRESRKRQNPPAHAPQFEDAGTPDAPERRRFRANPRSASVRRRETQDAPHPASTPSQGGHARRGTEHPHAESPAADEKAGANLGADG